MGLTYFAVVNADNVVLACYGCALRAEACNKAKEIQKQTGGFCAVAVREVTVDNYRDRPRVYQRLVSGSEILRL